MKKWFAGSGDTNISPTFSAFIGKFFKNRVGNKIMFTHKELSAQIEKILRVHGGKLNEHAQHIAAIFDLINKLLEQKAKPRAEIGFRPERG